MPEQTGGPDGTNGTVTQNDTSRSLYIANPKNAQSDFLVTVSRV